MADGTPECACGGPGSAEGGPRRLMFVCSGSANVGQVANHAGILLEKEGYGDLSCIALLANGPAGLLESAKEADEVVVIDGCPVGCALNIACAQGVTPGQYLRVTDFGMEKTHDRDPRDDEIECVVSAVWEGKGRVGPGR